VDGKVCTFHRWIEEDKALLKINAFTRYEEQVILRRRFVEEDVVPLGCSTEVVRRTYALIEFADGSVGKVDPELVQFIDREETHK
jgi:hypothetical protein